MGGIKPIGSEKLEGIDKIKRIMEIARYNENIPQAVNETKSTEYSINFADGNTYRIEKERQGYIIKVAINESESDYIDNMKSRKYYSSYSQALKRLNLMAKEINVLHENEEGISLIGEQKKKFILKTKKKSSNEPAAETPPPPASEPAPPTPPTPAPDMGAPAPDMGSPEGALPPPPSDMGASEGALPPPPSDMGSPEEGMEEPPADMGATEDDMGDSEPEPEMGMEDEEEMDVEVEKKPREKKVSDLKRIQILVGKLAQKIRSYEEEKELSPKEIKYIINSILSAIDVEVLDEDDIEQIIDKLEGTDDEDEGGEEEVSFDETEDEEEVAPEPPAEPEMAEGYDNFGDAFKDYMGGALASGMTKKLTQEEEDEFSDFEDDGYHKERRKRHFYPEVDSFNHGTFSESKVDKVLSKYFILNEEEEKQYIVKKERKTSQTYKSNKQNVIKLSESTEQLDVALDYIRENPRVKLLGITNKGNLIFKEGINEVRVTKFGKIL
jgi:hypothetical protein